MMKHIFGIALGAIGAAAVASPQAVVAQDNPATGSRFDRVDHATLRDARRELGYFGRCIAERKGKDIETFLATPTEESWSKVMDFPNNETGCINRRMSSSFVEIRGTVAEGWYVRNFRDGPPASFTASDNALPDASAALVRISQAPEAEQGTVVIEEFADCMAATHPVEVDHLLRTSEVSKDENEAIAALAPFFGSCAFEGHKLGFDQATLRANLAYALGRRVVQDQSAKALK